MPLPILCYHKVGPRAEEGRRLNVEPDRLVEHLRFFRRRGARFLAARDLARDWPRRGVCFTFDDAYVSTLTYGVEALVKEGTTASIYAVTDLVGKKSSWDVGNERPLADLTLLQRAHELGIEIGNHTSAHGDLSNSTADPQIDEAHAWLTRHGFHPGSVAYPFGKCGPGSRERAGKRYLVGLGLGVRMAEPEDDPLWLPRIVVGYGDHLPRLVYKLWVRPWMPTLRRRGHYVP